MSVQNSYDLKCCRAWPDLPHLRCFIAIAGSLFSFWGFVAASATDNMRKSINVVSEYDKSFCRKGPETALSKKRVFRMIRKELLAFTISRLIW
jgi:hypothetical protein